MKFEGFPWGDLCCALFGFCNVTPVPKKMDPGGDWHPGYLPLFRSVSIFPSYRLLKVDSFEGFFG